MVFAPFSAWPSSNFAQKSTSAKTQLSKALSANGAIVQYLVLASLKEDMNQGWIWISHPSISSRSIVEVKAGKKSIYCEALQIDHNYREAYKRGWTYDLSNDQPVLTISAWYRNKLGLDNTNESYELSIKQSNDLYGRVISSIQHPQVVVRLATWLGIISVSLGILGVGIAVW